MDFLHTNGVTNLMFHKILIMFHKFPVHFLVHWSHQESHHPKQIVYSNISWYKLTISLSWHTKLPVDVLGIGTYLTPFKQNELVPAEFWSCLYFRHFSSVKNGFVGSYYGKSWSVPCEIYTMTGGVMIILNESDFSHACVHAYMCHTCPSTPHGMLFERTQYRIYAIHFLVL